MNWKKPDEKPGMDTEVQMYLKGVQEETIGAYNREGFIGLDQSMVEHDSDGNAIATIDNFNDQVLLWKPLSGRPTKEELKVD